MALPPSRQGIVPTGNEAYFGENEIIVSKTSPKGIITYANDIFVRVSGYTQEETLGKPHNFIRHPAMPRCIFKLLWARLQAGKEIFAYVVNICKNGDHYWVFAHVTPTFDKDKNIIGFHSSRRPAPRKNVREMEELYKKLLNEERKHRTAKAAVDASSDLLASILKEKGMTYDEFIFSL